MGEKTLLKISIISSIIGIFILIIISESLVIKESSIKDVTKDKLDGRVKIIGEVTSVKETPGLNILNVKDNSGSIAVVVFKDEEIPFRTGLILEIQGLVVEYNGKMEIQAEEIKNVS